jgi:O-antigen ligase
MLAKRRLFVPVTLGFFGLLPLVSAAGGLAAAPLLGLAGVLSIQPSRLRDDLRAIPAAIWLLLAFLAWAAISSLWSSYHNHGQALRFWLTVLPGLIFASVCAGDASTRRWTRAAGLAALVLLIALVGAEAVFNMPLNRAFDHSSATWQIERNPGRGVAIGLAMVWAGAASLMSQRGTVRIGLGILAIVTMGALSTQFEDYANVAAFVVGLIAFGFGLWRPVLGVRLVSTGVAIWLLIAPFATPLLMANQRVVDMLPYSWAARVGIWRYVCGRIAEAPIFGSGLDASRAVVDTIVVRGVAMRAVQLHPHSASLQIWFESGGVGALLAACTLVFGGWTISRAVGENRTQAAAVCATFAALGLIANVGFGIWQEWWDATLLIGATLLLAIGARPHN